MANKKIDARGAVNDIKSGMQDAELMAKYHLTAKGLASLFQKLVEAKLLEESILLKRTAAATAARDAPSPSAPPAPSPPDALRPPVAAAGQPPKLVMAIARDIKAGMHDAEIMRRNEVSPGQLNQIKSSLVQAGLLDAAQISPSEGPKTKRCPFCHEEVKESASKCMHCGNWLDRPTSSPGPAAAAPGGSRPAAGPAGSPPAAAAAVPRPVVQHRDDDFEKEEECPWEDRESYGTLNAFFQTAMKCVLTPTAFFSKLPLTSGYWNPILFAAMAPVIGFLFLALWFILLRGGGIGGLLGLLIGMSLLFVVGLVVFPIAIAMWSAILHGCLYLVGGANEGYQATFRVVSYSSVTGLFNAIPFVGGIAATVWNIVLTVIGLKETHKTTTGKAIAAYLIPLGVVIVFVILMAVTVGIGIMAGLQRAAPGLSESAVVQNVPDEVCAALQAYVDRVDTASSLDTQAAQAEVQAAMQDLDTELKAFEKDSSVLVIMQKAMLFGVAAVAQSHSGGEFGDKLDQMREDLLKGCRK